jgi:phospholipase/carboxylesterase
MPPGGRHWYVIEQIGQPDEGSFVASIGQASRFIDTKLREREVSWERTVIGGFSQGGACAYAVGLGDGRPRPAGILGMSCFVPMVRGWRLGLSARRGLPVYITHGAFDPMIPVGFGRRARDVLTEAGLYVTYRESRIQHSIDPELLPEMSRWVASVVAGESQFGRSPI